jgi:hypothetical protein
VHALEDRRDICKVHSCTGSLIILIKKSIKSLKNNHFLEYAREWHSSRNDHGVDDPNPCGNLHRPRNQRLPSGRTLIPELIDWRARFTSRSGRGVAGTTPPLRRAFSKCRSLRALVSGMPQSVSRVRRVRTPKYRVPYDACYLLGTRHLLDVFKVLGQASRHTIGGVQYTDCSLPSLKKRGRPERKAAPIGARRRRRRLPSRVCCPRHRRTLLSVAKSP